MLDTAVSWCRQAGPPPALETGGLSGSGWLGPARRSKQEETARVERPGRTLPFYLFLKFIYFWLHWVFVAERGLSLVVVSRGYSSLRCSGFSLWRLLLLWSTGSRRVGFSSCGSRALESRLSSCGTRA